MKFEYEKESQTVTTLALQFKRSRFAFRWTRDGWGEADAEMKQRTYAEIGTHENRISKGIFVIVWNISIAYTWCRKERMYASWTTKRGSMKYEYEGNVSARSPEEALFQAGGQLNEQGEARYITKSQKHNPNGKSEYIIA